MSKSKSTWGDSSRTWKYRAALSAPAGKLHELDPDSYYEMLNITTDGVYEFKGWLTWSTCRNKKEFEAKAAEIRRRLILATLIHGG